jgi:hypothetical protein
LERLQRLTPADYTPGENFCGLFTQQALVNLFQASTAISMSCALSGVLRNVEK